MNGKTRLRAVIIVSGAIIAILGSVFVDAKLKALDRQTRSIEADHSKLQTILARVQTAREAYYRVHDSTDDLSLDSQRWVSGTELARRLYEHTYYVRLVEFVRAACSSADISDDSLESIFRRCGEIANSTAKSSISLIKWGDEESILKARSFAATKAFSYNSHFYANLHALQVRDSTDESHEADIQSQVIYWQRFQLLITGLGIIVALAHDLVPGK